MKQQVTAMLFVAILSTSLPALAEGHFGGGHGEGFGQGRGEGSGEGHHGMRFGGNRWGGERDIRHFEDHHLSLWRSGGWRHGSHEGRFGWWWIAAGTWYFYPAPIYPYPNPYIPPVLIMQPPPDSGTIVMQSPPQSWYYCEASKSYFPYVPSCPAGWITVPATPPQAPVKPPVNSAVPPSDPSY